MKKFLVTGGAGFIGSNLVRKLAEEFESCRVYVVDDFYSGRWENLCRPIQWHSIDVMDVRTAEWSCFDYIGLDAVFHLSAIADPLFQGPMIVEVNSSIGLIKQAVYRDIPVVFASSASIYGKRNSPMHEGDMASPDTAYAFSKCALEANAIAIMGNVEHAPKCVGLRFFNVYGPGDVHKGRLASMVTQLHDQMSKGVRPTIFHDGHQRRDFVHVDDCCEMMIRAAESGVSGIFNCGTGHATSFIELIEMMNEAGGTDLWPQFTNDIPSHFQPFTQADTTKSSDVFGFTPSHERLKEYIGGLFQNVPRNVPRA